MAKTSSKNKTSVKTKKTGAGISPKLSGKIKKAKELLLAAHEKFGDKMAIFWTGGKDSTVLLHIVRSVFGDDARFPILYLDTQLDFEEVYEFIEKMKKDWGLDLITVRTDEEMMKKYNALKTKPEKVVLASKYKIVLLKKAVKDYRLPAVVIGIRRDEHKERISEKDWSPREDHVRIHPILDWTEDEIWAYTREFKLPYISLYDKGYRSLGEKDFTEPAAPGGDERSGRHKEREVIMKQLRAMGYF